MFLVGGIDLCNLSRIVRIHFRNYYQFKTLKNLVRYSSSRINMDKSFFQGVIDIHNGITVDSIQEPCESLNEFNNKLQESLKKWQSNKIRGVWFNVALMHAEWIPVLAQNGFKVHHGSGNFISLCRWLPEHESNRIPHFAHAMLGAGAVVVNSKNQILVVCEKYRDIPFYKLPGGYVDPGEDIVEAAIREVLEETSVKTEFVSLVSLRHTKKSVFGCSDIYFIVELKPLTENLKREEEEIEEVMWMNIDEYLNHPMVHDNNRLFIRKYLENHSAGVSIQREITYHPITKVPQSLYSITGSTKT